MFKWFIISLLIFCSSNFCYSQTILKFVDQQSNKPPSDFLFYLIQDSITFINCGIPNSEGILKFRKIEENKNHTYQIKFNQLKYEHIFKNIAINNSDTTIIYLKHNNYFIEEDSNYYSNRPSEISLLPYIPRTIRSFNDLPSDILEKVKTYLNNRFSNNFSKNFELTIGLIIDVDYLKRKNPEYNNNTNYYLNFSYRNLNAGISMFNSTLKLDKNGNVLKDLDFPIIKSDSLKIYSFN